ncbi:MAG: hypothetical protein WBM35_00150 [Candidatus Electrothrix sp.]
MKNKFMNCILTVLLITVACFLLEATGAQAGSIKGNVLDELSSTPIGNLLVGTYADDDEKSLIKSVLTDIGTGEYILDNLPDGTYKVVFFTYHTDYIQEWYSGGTDVYNFADAEPVSVSGTAEKDLGNILLKKGAKITGTVTEEDSLGGVKISGVLAMAYDADGNWATSAKLTGDDGVYSLGGLRTGDYRIQFRAAFTGYASEWYLDKYTLNTADTMTISSLNDELVSDVELGPGDSISGEVIDSKGTAIVGAVVKVYDSNSDSTDSPIGIVTTGGDGTYVVAGLPLTKTFRVQFFEREGDGSGAGFTEWYNDKRNFDSADIVSLGAGGTGATGVDAMLEPNFNWWLFTPALTHRPTP